MSVLPTPKVVCLDPGHPSEVGRGTRGKFVTELDVAWDVSLLLQKEIEKNGHRVVLTKQKVGTLVKNKARAAVANNAKADLMVRLHCDSAPGETGFATFYADRQGKDGSVRGPSQSVLKRVKPMAQAFHVAVMKSLKGSLNDRGLRTDMQTKVGSERGALIGSIHSKVPSILVEMVVLDDPGDEAFVRSKAGKAKLVRALASGIKAALSADPVGKI